MFPLPMGLLGSNGYGGTLSAQVAAIFAGFSGPKVWYDPRDIATLQQDSAGTTPVTAAGDPIGRIMDKSGAANHATQATGASRPLWQTTYAAFDGVDKSWATANIDFTSTDRATVVVGVRKLSDVSTGLISELSPAVGTNNGAFAIFNAAGPGPNFQTISRGTALSTATVSGVPAPITAVVSAAYSLSASTTLRVNGVSNAAGTAGGGNFGNYPLFIGRRNSASLPFNGNVYGLIVIGRLLTAPELTLCEQYMAQQAGI